MNAWRRKNSLMFLPPSAYCRRSPPQLVFSHGVISTHCPERAIPAEAAVLTVIVDAKFNPYLKLFRYPVRFDSSLDSDQLIEHTGVANLTIRCDSTEDHKCEDSKFILLNEKTVDLRIVIECDEKSNCIR
jgi:hypothetical protein